jgi:hypothetical protein
MHTNVVVSEIDFVHRQAIAALAMSCAPTGATRGSSVTASNVGIQSRTRSTAPASRLSFGISAILGSDDNDDSDDSARKSTSSEQVPRSMAPTLPLRQHHQQQQQQQYGPALAAAALAAVAGRAYLFTAAAAAAGLHGNQNVLTQSPPMMMMMTSPTGALQLAAAQHAAAAAAAAMASCRSTEHLQTTVRPASFQLQQRDIDGEQRKSMTSSDAEQDDEQVQNQRSISSFGDGIIVSPSSALIGSCDGSVQSQASAAAIFPWMQERKDRLCGMIHLLIEIVLLVLSSFMTRSFNLIPQRKYRQSKFLCVLQIFAKILVCLSTFC